MTGRIPNWGKVDFSGICAPPRRLPVGSAFIRGGEYFVAGVGESLVYFSGVTRQIAHCGMQNVYFSLYI